jgi:hypothetical protein
MEQSFTLPLSLVQGICNLLNELPAKNSRSLLNDIERACSAAAAAPPADGGVPPRTEPREG